MLRKGLQMHRLTLPRTAAALMVVGICAAVVTAAPPASFDDVKSLYETGDYKGAVAGASRLIGNLHAPAPAGVDRAGLCEIKGECHLHLKQYNEAADAFAAAAHAAEDPAKASVDRATELLIRRSRAGFYKPVQPAPGGAKPSPIDLNDLSARKAAFAALFADEWAAAAGKVKGFDAARALPALLVAADTIGSLRDLEMTATDADAVTKPAMAVIAGHAKEPFSIEMRKLDRRAADIKAAANTMTTYWAHVDVPAGQAGANTVARSRRVGLNPRNTADLKAIVAECKRLGPVAETFAKTADDAATWDALNADATRITGVANDTLTDDYSSGTQDR